MQREVCLCTPLISLCVSPWILRAVLLARGDLLQREESPLMGSNKRVLTPRSFPRAVIVSGHGSPNCRWVFGWRGSRLLPYCSPSENCTRGYCQLAAPKVREAAPSTPRWLRSRLGAARFAPDMLCHLLKLLLASTAMKIYLSVRNAGRKLKCFSSFLIKVRVFHPNVCLEF